MGCSKILLIILLLGAATVSTEFDPDRLEWESITSFREIRAMRMINDTAYVATSGGLMKIADPDQPPVVMTNLDGLGTVDLTDVIQDDSGDIWVAGNGRIIRLDNSPKVYPLSDNDNLPVRFVDIADDGDYLWLGMDRGLELFSKRFDGGLFEDYFQQFGNLNPSPQVNDIALLGDSIWLATSVGIAVGDRTDPSQLKSGSGWRTYNSVSYPELLSDSIGQVVAYNGQIYAGTADGLYVIGRNAADTDDSLILVPIGVSKRVYDLKVENDSLFYYRFFDMGVVNGQTSTALLFSGDPPSWTTGLNTGTMRWVVRANFDGLYDLRSGAPIEYRYAGMPGKNVSDLSLGSNGDLIIGLTEQEAAIRVNGDWTIYPIFRNSTNVMVDSSGGQWVGSFGAGLFQLFDDSMVVYDKNNSPLVGNNDDPTFFFTVIEDIATDGLYLYVAAYRAATGYPIGIADLGRIESRSGWDSLGIADGLVNDRPVSLDIYGGQLAVGTEAVGVYLCNVGSDPFNHSGNICRLFNEQNSRLVSNNTRIVRYAPDGTLWVGTTFGLSRFDNGIDRFDSLSYPAQIGTDIVAMEFDTRGNLWIGGRGGVARRDATTGDFVALSTSDGLVDNRVNAIHYDRYTGDIYVATQAGISRIRSTGGRPPQQDIAEVAPFPNPYVIRNGNERLSFNFDRDGDVTIFSLAGEHVADVTVNGGWDGRNHAGADVASGVYIFVVKDSEGEIGRGKILLVRE